MTIVDEPKIPTYSNLPPFGCTWFIHVFTEEPLFCCYKGIYTTKTRDSARHGLVAPVGQRVDIHSADKKSLFWSQLGAKGIATRGSWPYY